MSDEHVFDDWLMLGLDELADQTCPDGFCRHWSCNSECDRKCGRCGIGCAEHEDGEGVGAIAHKWVEEVDST